MLKPPPPLRIIRVQLGLSQDEVAKAVGTNESLISRLENGHLRDTPGTLRLKARVAEFLGVAIEEIFPPTE